ncbi:Cd2+/Zn2+-exporting ATPase [Amphibacillus marinus]|uniref:Cd2+/Zn2+-exporting ATPase n=1 Tax=Amphibacillus marinus TaxID=872970 RepID=A0A1H8REL9_9BACI|nr:heavy metal translocating P-type ATPase [Amphibacillus marinus]SEO64979.1 Cd2+/Zn2+-exporting ATPase [Amphibacillus marinus]
MKLFRINLNSKHHHSQLTVLVAHFLKQHGELLAALTSGLIILLSNLLYSHLSYYIWIGLNIAGFLVGGFAKAKEGIVDTLTNKRLNVELLMILAAIGSASIGFWTEGATLIFIFSLSGALETYTLQKNERELTALMQLQPETATRLTTIGEEIVDTDQLSIGDLILIKAGERIPADGVITRGKSTLDESALTGEATPVLKKQNDHVLTGTINLTGAITVKVTLESAHSFVQKIMALVQAAQREKSPSQLFIDRFENLYVKVIVSLVLMMTIIPPFLLGWEWKTSIYRAMILLVVASPCALIVSIMPATLSAISSGARQGILFKSGQLIERLKDTDLIIFDKTGTLTAGKPAVTDFIVENGANKTAIMQIVGKIESQASHPLGQSLVNFCANALVLPSQEQVAITEMSELTGKGIFATVNDHEWVIGNERTLIDQSPDNWYQANVQRLLAANKTVVYVSDNHKVVAIIALKDSIRPDTLKAIHHFHKLGIDIVMLTGDNEQTASAIAMEADIKHYVANCLPEDKVNKIKQLQKQYTTIMMVGDGINDAPALATANIGVAMGAGTDVALETADIILIKNKLEKIIYAYRLSIKMNRIVKQNIIFSLTVIVLLIITNFLQLINLPLGVLGHEGSTILVILNGLRLAPPLLTKHKTE